MPLDGEGEETNNLILENAVFCRSKGKNGECLLLENGGKKCDASICPKSLTRFASIFRENGGSLFYTDNSSIDRETKEANLDVIMTRLRMHLDFLMDAKLKRPPFLDVYFAFSDA
jgi:hypothetical protein